MVAVKFLHKIENIGFNERAQNILLFELSIVNPIYLECHISRNPGFYSLSSPTPPQIEILGLILLCGYASAYLIRVPSCSHCTWC